MKNSGSQGRFTNGPGIDVQTGDLAVDDFHDAIAARVIGWDIETSGLDWRTCEIGTCQVSIGDEKTVIVQIKGSTPEHLGRLLADERVRKVFHHATFDLRFMAHRWKARAANVACTKIASKLLDPDRCDHSLKTLLHDHLQVRIDKSERMSDWTSDRLTREQISYASMDVKYLVRLLMCLEDQLAARGRLALAQACFLHVPTRVQLDIGGYGDVYEY